MPQRQNRLRRSHAATRREPTVETRQRCHSMMQPQPTILPTKRIVIARKAAAEEVVDDWENDDLEPLPQPQPQPSVVPESLQAQAQLQDEFPALGGLSLHDRKALPSSVWQKANTSSGGGQVTIQPSAVSTKVPLIAFQSPGIQDGGVPKILRRESPAPGSRAGGTGAKGSMGSTSTAGMTLGEREKAYAQARARIFGAQAEESLPTFSETKRKPPGRGGASGARGGSRGRDHRSGSSSPASTPTLSRTNSTTNATTERPGNGRQPRGPQEGSSGFGRR